MIPLVLMRGPGSPWPSATPLQTLFCDKDAAVVGSAVASRPCSMLVSQYRTLGNYRNPEFLGPRIGDKVIFSLLLMSLYWCAAPHLPALPYLEACTDSILERGCRTNCERNGAQSYQRCAEKGEALCFAEPALIAKRVQVHACCLSGPLFPFASAALS